MFENNSPLVRQSNIFRDLKNYCKDNNIEIPGDISKLSGDMIAEFKRYDDSIQFVFDIFQMYDAMFHRQLFALIGASSIARDIAMYGETKERNKFSIHPSSGILAANGYVNQLFELDLLEPYASATGKVSEAQRSDYLLHLAACYFSNEHASNFRNYLNASQLVTFDSVSAKTEKVHNFGTSLFQKKESLQKHREAINVIYNDKGFIYSADGSVVGMMDFDVWAEQEGCKTEYDQIGKSIENLCMPIEEIIRKGLAS